MSTIKQGSVNFKAAVYTSDSSLFNERVRKIQILFFFISFLLKINLKLIIVHVEIKIVNKEAATKRSTLLHA